MDFKDSKIVQAGERVAALGKSGIAPLFQLFQGRCTFFACVFTTVGIILAFKGKLDGNYVALVGAVQVLLVAHSAKEDYYSDAQQAQNVTIVNNLPK